MGLCILAESADAPLGRPAKNARFRNTWQTAVQHDQTARGAAVFEGKDPAGTGSADDRQAGLAITPLRIPVRAPSVFAHKLRRRRPADAGGAEPGMGADLADHEDRA